PSARTHAMVVRSQSSTRCVASASLAGAAEPANLQADSAQSAGLVPLAGTGLDAVVDLVLTGVADPDPVEGCPEPPIGILKRVPSVATADALGLATPSARTWSASLSASCSGGPAGSLIFTGAFETAPSC